MSMPLNPNKATLTNSQICLWCFCFLCLILEFFYANNSKTICCQCHMNIAKGSFAVIDLFLLLAATFLLAPFLIRSCYLGQGSGWCECTKSGASLDTRYLFFNVPWYFLAINCIVEELFLQTLLENNCFLRHIWSYRLCCSFGFLAAKI